MTDCTLAYFAGRARPATQNPERLLATETVRRATIRPLVAMILETLPPVKVVGYSVMAPAIERLPLDRTGPPQSRIGLLVSETELSHPRLSGRSRN